MRYCLSQQYEFCGFKGRTYGICDLKTGEYIFPGKEAFFAIYRLACGYEEESLSLTEETAGAVQKAKDSGVLKPSSDLPAELPKYTEYKNRFKESVHWSITGRCNARCRHCFQESPQGRPGQPTLEQCMSVIRQLRECGIRKVELTGGEPLVRKDFWEIADALRDNGIKLTTVYSNGLLIDQALIDEFRKRGLHPAWQISFDGIGWHDWLRGVEGAEKKTLDAIRLLISNGFRVACAMCIHKKNMDTVEESLELLASLGVCAVKASFIMKQGAWLNYPEYHTTLEEELAFYKKLAVWFARGDRKLDLQCEGVFWGHARTPEQKNSVPFSFPLISKYAADRPDRCAVCEALRQSVYIGSSGNVVPCMGMDGSPAVASLPNLFRTPLSEILTESAYTRYAYASAQDVFDHNEECRKCDKKQICGGGCRMFAICDDANDYFAIDRRSCHMLREDWVGQVKTAIRS